MNRKIYSYSVVGIGIGILIGIFIMNFTWTNQAAADSQQLAPHSVDAVGTSFTYQGYLDDSGSAADGFYDFEFSLYDASVGGSQVGSTLVINAVNVSNGLFTVKLDFGFSAFGADARWLEISVRPAGGGGYTLLSPRQELTPAPAALSMPNVFTNESQNFVGIGRDSRVSSSEVFGVRYVGGANEYGGMYVETANDNGWPFYGYATNGSYRAWTYYNGTNGDWSLYNNGIRIIVPDEGGLQIGSATSHSLVISDTTGVDGIHIYETGDDGIQVGQSPSQFSNYGLYIPPNPGVNYYGLWPNTADGAGQWALYTVDNINAGNVFANAYSLVAKVSGEESLNTGDVIAVAGVTDPIPGSTVPLPLVRAANDTNFTGVIGVVASRMVWDVAPGKEADGAMSMHNATGPARPGDYVSLVIYGITEVNISPGNNIAAGDQLTVAASSGHVRALQTRMIDGMTVTEGVPVVGIALKTPEDGETSIPIFVTLR